VSRSWCRLHGGKLIDHWPKHCALAQACPAELVNTLKNEAYKAMDPEDPQYDPQRGLHLLHQATHCGDCIHRLTRDPAVIYMRRDVK